MRLCLSALAGCLFVLAFVGCGNSEETNTGVVSEANAVKTSCTLKGSKKAKVNLSYAESGLTFTFKGQPVPSTGTALYSVEVWDKSGENGAQLGVKYLNDRQIAYFVFDPVEVQQTNLSLEAKTNGYSIEANFPAESLGPLADSGPDSWSAVLSVNGKDVGICPSGYNTIPFS